MPDTKTKVSSLLDSSRAVLLNCCLENGAVIAANTDHPHYPKNASDYRYVWPRDAAFILYALRLLGEDRTRAFCEWLIERAESFDRVGLFFRRYATHGACSWPDNEFQPDQAGTLLWALSHENGNDPVIKKATVMTANALCRTWHNDHFSAVTHDLWEHVRNNNQTHGSFTYSLAACKVGLEKASKLDTKDAKTWLKVAKQMGDAIDNSDSEAFYPRLTHSAQNNVDASLLGMVWPFHATNDRQKLENTLDKIKSELLIEKGIMRFKSDVYDGIIRRSLVLNYGAGAWPLLTFWYAIACHKLNRTEEARAIFEKLIHDLPEDYIPEQLFDDNKRIGVTPLGWSHAMFVIACRQLGYI